MANTNQTVLVSATIKKSTIKTIIVIVSAVILGGLGAWYINAMYYLPFSSDLGAAFSLVGYWICIIIASVVLTLAASAVLFRFVKIKLKWFMLVSGAVSLLIGAFLANNLMCCMVNSVFWIFGNTNDFATAVSLDIMYHFIYAAIVFGIAMVLYKPMKKLAK